MILHLDMDAFFASVEQTDNPQLKGKPVIIGGEARGVVATASYEARKYGIHSAMPTATARKLCPHGIFLHGRHRRYAEISARVMAALRQFSPVVQAASIDEAYLDISGLRHIYVSPLEAARDIKKCVAETTGGLTCSIGIAPIKFLAKICSDVNKPNGIFILGSVDVEGFLRDLPIERLPGVGKSMSASLHSFGISRVGQIRALSREFMVERYGKWGAALHDRANGIDERKVHENEPAKSESAECTFERDIWDKQVLREALLAHAERVGARLRKNGYAGRSITLKIKFADFRTITRTRTLAMRTNATQTIYEVGRILLDVERLPKPVRLIGLGVSGFDFRPAQLWLPGMDRAGQCHDESRRLRIDKAMDKLADRFGKGIIQRAAVRESMEKRKMK